MAHHRNMGRRRRQGNTTTEKPKNLIDSMENEVNKHPMEDSSRMMISMSNESNDVYKDRLKEELKKELISTHEVA
jgi:hypothetical protein